MRLTKTLGAVAAFTFAIAAVTATSASHAGGDEELVNVSCKGGEVSVSAKAPWHVNAAAPWKWDKGDKVSLDEHAAKFKGAKCEGTVKAYICSGDQCKGPIAKGVN
jgi:uncharacterized protein YyaL (SSP411 family)